MKKVYVREEVCIGCRLCEVYCQLQHADSSDLVRAFKKESPPPLPRLRVDERGVVSLSVHCQQCDDAPCVQACLTGALSRDPESSLVTVDEDRCIGCWTCVLVCPLAAIPIGGIAAIISYYGMLLFKMKLGMDDSLDVFACHGLGGIWGALATGIFAMVAVNAGGADGLLMGNGMQFLKQVVGVVAVGGFAFVATWLLGKLVDVTMGLRVNETEEMLGLDISQHGERAYGGLLR